MDDCGAANLLAKCGCILTYGGSELDICINYTLLILDVAFCTWWLNISHRSTIQPLISLIGVMIYQVVLCLFLGCSGVSIVWCAVIGWYIQKSRCSSQGTPHEISPQNSALVSRAETVLLLLNAAALIYYAITSEMITSVAHGCALLLGMALSKLESCRCCTQERPHGYQGPEVP